MSRFQALYECYYSGQMTERDMAAAMRDAVFAAFVRRKEAVRFGKGRR